MGNEIMIEKFRKACEEIPTNQDNKLLKLQSEHIKDMQRAKNTIKNQKYIKFKKKQADKAIEELEKINNLQSKKYNTL